MWKSVFWHLIEWPETVERKVFMSRNFEKIKKKIRLATIIKFVLFGIALGVLAAAAFVVVQKLMAMTPQLVWAVVLGGAVALVATLLSLWIKYPTEKRIAKRLDERLHMNEKVQTMVEFRGQDGEMLQMQRSDTESILSSTPKKQLRDRRAWVQLVLPVIALSIAAAAIILPVRTESSAPVGEGPGEEDIWELTEWHVTAVRVLIEEVKASEMQQPGRETVVEIMEKMLVDLEYVHSKSLMKRTVMDAMVRIDAVTNRINSYTAIVRAMRGAGNTKVKDLADAIGVPADPIIESKYQALKAGLVTETLGADVKQFATAIDVAIGTASVAVEDALYAALAEFSAQLATFAQTADGLPTEEASSALTRVFETAAESIGAALNQQGINRKTTDDALNGLMSIFDISWNELPDELKYSDDEEASTEDNEYEEKEDEILGGGGKGNGEVIYGSDDAIYYPKDETHVKYGDVIDEYNGQKVTEMQERPLTDEQKEFIDKYFADLYYKDKND